MDSSLVPVVVGSAAATISSLVALLTIMFNARTARMREERNRKWDVEDRAHRAEASLVKTQELTAAIADVREKTLASTQAQHTTRQMLTNAIAQVQKKTEEGIEASKGAQDVANHANSKLEAIGLRVAAMAKRDRPDGA